MKIFKKKLIEILS